ncbi:MAG: hypothetical protein EBZ48_02950, partial [Proteobacteria bacterium]|nr:hypothetical protein [Pseudomonadota bacterium]
MGEQSSPDVVRLMEDIRARVDADIQRHGGGAKETLRAGFEAPTFIALMHSEDLRAINRGHAFAANLNPDSIRSHRGGLAGRIVVALKRKCFGMLRDSLLREYFSAEHEFHAHLVKHINVLSRELEERSAALRRLEARLAALESAL